MPMDRQAFFASLRARNSGVFGTSLKQRQVQGIEALLDAAKGLPLHHVANILAQVYHETGAKMYPVRETFADSDEQAIARLDRAWTRGQLTWVRKPYWRADSNGKAWFGRGQIQITHKSNYSKFGITNPDDALRLPVSARVAVEGMSEGKFTGKKLSDYAFPEALSAPSARNPRRIVNGRDGTDAKVAGYHRAFAAALEAGGYVARRSAGRQAARLGAAPHTKPPTPARAPVTVPTQPRMGALMRFLKSIFGGRNGTR
jgi:predicted chitinase